MIKRMWPALLLDAALVVVFATIGRASHSEGLTAAGIVGTSGPFLIGVAFGWVLQWIFEKKPAITMSDGVTIWVVTVAAGMTVRHLVGDGTAIPFIVVATVVLGVFLLGWRLLNTLAARRAAQR